MKITGTFIILAFYLAMCNNPIVEKSTDMKDTTIHTGNRPDYGNNDIAFPEIDSVKYIETGRNIAIEARTKLFQNLSSAISEMGYEGAISFCNVNAIKITDSASKVLNVKIRRVTDKARNPANKANEEESAYIKKLIAAKKSGEKILPLLSQKEGMITGYYPIETNTMCLPCHGIPGKTIPEETLIRINQLYPADQATGYSENEIRGLMVVEMKKPVPDSEIH